MVFRASAVHALVGQPGDGFEVQVSDIGRFWVSSLRYTISANGKLAAARCMQSTIHPHSPYTSFTRRLLLLLLLLRPPVHNGIHQPKLDRLLGRHVVIPLQRLFEPIPRILRLFLRRRAVRDVDVGQLGADPQDLFRVEGDIACLALSAAAWFWGQLCV